LTACAPEALGEFKEFPLFALLSIDPVLNNFQGEAGLAMPRQFAKFPSTNISAADVVETVLSRWGSH
jgi:hypothetical protein